MTQLVQGYNFWWRRARLPAWSCMVGLNALHVSQLKALFPQGSHDQMCKLMMFMCQQVFWAPSDDLPSPQTEYHRAWAKRMNEMLNTAVQNCITDAILSEAVGSPFFDPTTAGLCLNDTFNTNSLEASSLHAVRPLIIMRNIKLRV